MAHDVRLMSNWWNTIDFHPAPPGWRVVYLYPQIRQTFPIAGWLIQDRYTQGVVDPYPVSIDLDSEEQVLGRRRRVIPGIVTEVYDWAVQAIDDNHEDNDNIWKVLAPGEPDPTDEEEQAERARRAGTEGGPP